MRDYEWDRTQHITTRFTIKVKILYRNLPYWDDRQSVLVQIDRCTARSKACSLHHSIIMRSMYRSSVVTAVERMLLRNKV